MKILELIRLEESENGTVGVLKIDKIVFCFTLEPPDEENVTNISSIPAQQYLCRPYDSPKFGPTWQVTHVPGRTYILFHAGNVVDHTAGCILLGSSVGKLHGDRAVLNSGATFTGFRQVLAGETGALLIIREVY